MDRVKYILKYHLHVILYLYFWFGLFVCGLAAPRHRVEELGSSLVSQGWHLSLLSLFLVLPVPLAYLWRMRRPRARRGEKAPLADRPAA
ncbi:MAG: hypothetical protein JRI97_06835 [Deltaproteobacteria bacterium]|nr:hypothetical protein [Deltaproteobacteria bacterium]